MSDADAPPTAALDNLHAVTLFVADLGRARAFYLDILELRLVYEDDSSAVFKLGATLINLLAEADARELVAPAAVGARDAGFRAMFTIEVADVDATCRRLEARGVRLLNGPVDRPWGVRTAAFADPAGHVWELARPITAN